MACSPPIRILFLIFLPPIFLPTAVLAMFEREHAFDSLDFTGGRAIELNRNLPARNVLQAALASS